MHECVPTCMCSVVCCVLTCHFIEERFTCHFRACLTCKKVSQYHFVIQISLAVALRLEQRYEAFKSACLALLFILVSWLFIV